MSEEEIRDIARDTIGQQIRENIDSALIFKYVSDLEKENEELKEEIEEYKRIESKDLGYIQQLEEENKIQKILIDNNLDITSCKCEESPIGVCVYYDSSSCEYGCVYCGRTI